MSLIDTLSDLICGGVIAAVLYLAVMGLLEWAIKRDDPQCPRNLGDSRVPSKSDTSNFR